MCNFEIPTEASELKAKALGLKHESEDLTRTAFKLVFNVAPELNAERYDILAAELRNMLKKNVYGDPINEFIRRAVTFKGEKLPKHPRNYCEAVAFYKSYRKLNKQLHEALDGADLSRSDDGYSDLLDMLPLTPSGKLLTLLTPRKFEGTFQHWEETNKVELYDILQGEKYVSSGLNSALELFLPSSVTDHKVKNDVTEICISQLIASGWKQEGELFSKMPFKGAHPLFVALHLEISLKASP